MSQVSGILSLFFIAAAFLTSCDEARQPQGTSAIQLLKVDE